MTNLQQSCVPCVELSSIKLGVQLTAIAECVGLDSVAEPLHVSETVSSCNLFHFNSGHFVT